MKYFVVILLVLLLGASMVIAQTDQLTPSAIQKTEAIQARAYMDNAKIKPLMFVTSPMPISHSTPREVFGEIAAGRNVYLVDLKAALGYYDTLAAKPKDTGVKVPALANLRKSVAEVTPPKPDEIIVSDIGAGFYLVALPPLGPRPLDEIIADAKDQLAKKGFIVKGTVVVVSLGQHAGWFGVPPTSPQLPDIQETPQYLILFVDPSTK